METQMQAAQAPRKTRLGGHLSRLYSYQLAGYVTAEMGAAIEAACEREGIRKFELVRRCLAACLTPKNGASHD